MLVIPDFIANSGGVIAGSVELRGGTVEESFELVKRLIRANVRDVLSLSRAEGIHPRTAAETMARRRVLTAMKDKGRL